MGTLIKWLSLLLLLVILVIAGVGAGIYVYLTPEEPPPNFASNSSIRSTTSGELIGTQGRYDAHAWLGIPYAEPPVGEFRWRAPQSPAAWQGRYEALEYGSACAQLQVLPGSQNASGITGSEDCLYLNVWAPAYHPEIVPKGRDRLPVMFWIHGGGNTIGSGNSDNFAPYDGSFLATEQDVIVVTVNYRMGPLGWFAPEALQNAAASVEDASGNFGTLDTIAALKWVQDNISQFGGDPGNVTIFGESAGGVNVMSLVTSPLATGLFHKAIVQSGLHQLMPMSAATELGVDHLGNDILSSKELMTRWMMAEGLATRKAEALELINSMSSEDQMMWLRSLDAPTLYGSFDETVLGMVFMPMMFADGFVLPASREQAFTSDSSYNRVPIMLGTNRDEAKLFMGFLPEHMEFRGEIPWGLKNPEAYHREAGYSSDLWRADGVDVIASALAQHQNNVYSYRFDADDWRHVWLFDFKAVWGAAHALEIPFVFGWFPEPMKVVFPDSSRAELELLSSAMMSYWTQFAYTGHPASGRHGELPLWLPWESGSTRGNFMALDTDLDAGIRMERQVYDRDEIIDAFMNDASYATTEEHCAAYMAAFGMGSFDPDQYAALGCQ